MCVILMFAAIEKMRQIVLIYLLLIGFNVFSQESDIPRINQKFEFEKRRSNARSDIFLYLFFAYIRSEILDNIIKFTYIMIEYIKFP